MSKAITLTNRLVQEDLYKLLNLENDPYIWTFGNYKGEHKLVIRSNETTTTYYPYNTKKALEADYNEIIRLKNLLS